jgi:phenylpyruvate tautomerase PptA (4-oxalocrotonate tautomerase family)
MPLWQIYHPPNTFTTPESKQALATDITKYYTKSLPAFYVVVQFHALAPDNVFVGGTSQAHLERPMIRIVVNHVAVTASEIPDDQQRFKRICEGVDAALRPHIEAKGYDWEYHIDETDRGLWKLNGLVPPPWRSEEEKEWVRANKALPWAGDGKARL